jgi:GNAT superfamily N-acetyltransferase
VSRVYVAVTLDQPTRLLGYFTLSPTSVMAADLPPNVAKRLPRHPIPAALVGRLAVDRAFARRGLGSVLLADAVKKAAHAARMVAMTVVVVDPIDEAARAFYLALGFLDLEAPQRRMFLSLPRDAI